MNVAKLALAACVVALGATGADAWQSSAGGAFVSATVVAVDAAGDVVAGGLALDAGGDSLFVTKLAGASGAPRWRTVVSGPVADSLDRLDAIAIDPQGDVVAAGALFRRESFNPQFFLVVKLAGTSGAELWRHVVRGCTYNEAFALAVDHAGDVVAAGGRCAEGAVAPHFTVTKLDGADGTVAWQYSLDDEGAAAAVAVDAQGDVVAAGAWRRRFTVVKVAGSDGAPIWRRVVGNGEARSVGLDSGGDVVAGGAIRRPNTSTDFTVAKLSGRSGAPRWRRSIRGSGRPVFDPDEDVRRFPQNGASALVVAPRGDVIAVGFLENLRTGTDFFAVKLAGAGGAERWRRVIKGTDGSDTANALALDTQGDVITVGRISAPEVVQGLGVVKLAKRDGRVLWRLPASAGTASAVALDAGGHPAVTAVDAFPTGAPVVKLRGDTGADF